MDPSKLLCRAAAEILIFGGTGFIGRHLCVELSRRRVAATVISRNPDTGFLREYAPGIEAISLQSFESSAVTHCKNARVLVHLASTTLPGTYHDAPWREISAAVEPSVRLFAQAASQNPELRVVFLSSGGTVYGAAGEGAYSEDAPLRPISAYGYGKLAQEEALHLLGRTKGLSYTILRASNPIGRWQTNARHGIVNVAVNAAREGNPLVLFDSGRQVRDFFDADDLAEAIVLSALDTTPRQVTWNVGSGKGVSIATIVEQVELALDCKIKRDLVPGRGFDVPRVVLDCSKIRRDLGWTARTPLDSAIRKIVSREIRAAA